MAESAPSVFALLRTYVRALGLLRDERRTVLLLVVANVALGLLQLAEPILFGRVVDALSHGGSVYRLIGIWAVLGVGSIAAGVTVALFADRLAHRHPHYIAVCVEVENQDRQRIVAAHCHGRGVHHGKILCQHITVADFAEEGGVRVL